MANVYLGLGSNLGNRSKNIRDAIALLSANEITVCQQSTFMETAPVGGPPGQNHYLNGVIQIETDRTPHQLLNFCKRIERQLGRVTSVRNGPRPIDIDILIYDRLRMHTPRLTIPHPRMFARDFVMIPLKEIAPKLIEELDHATH